VVPCRKCHYILQENSPPGELLVLLRQPSYWLGSYFSTHSFAVPVRKCCATLRRSPAQEVPSPYSIMESHTLRNQTRKNYKLLHEGRHTKDSAVAPSSTDDSSSHSEAESHADILPEFFHSKSVHSTRYRRGRDGVRIPSNSSDDDIVSLNNKEASIDVQIERLKLKKRIMAKEATLSSLQGPSSAPKHSSSVRHKKRHCQTRLVLP
jgi:hypothetical protein